MTKENYENAKKISVITIILLLSSGLSSLIPTTNAQIQPRINFTWILDTYSTEVTTTWDQTSFVMNHTGTYTDVFNYSYGHAISADEWIEEETVFTYDINYTYVSNTTLTGKVAMRTILDVYRVDVSYGKELSLIWLALRNGTYETEAYLSQYEQDYTYSNDYYRKAETTYNKYNLTTMSLIDTWNDTVEDQGSWTSTPAPSPFEYEYQYATTEMDFTMPLILTFEIFETENNEKVAWAEMFSDFYVFNDTDKNAIYSLGETKTAPYYMSIQTSDENCGAFIPWAVDWDTYNEYVVKDHPEMSGNESHNMKFPGDYETNEVASWIEFTPPELPGSEVIWNINYQDYPIWAQIQSQMDPMDYYYCGWDAPYSTTSPGNFSYGFNFGVVDNRADLDLTTSLPKLSNPSFYDAVQGLSLAIPHYSFFLSSGDLKEKAKKVITVPSNLFQYDINETMIAEINMENDAKKYYTLFDYPSNGETRQFQSIGSTVSKVISNAFEFNPTTPRNYFVDMIFTIKDFSLVKNDPDLVSPYTLYNIQIQNYPVWSGEKLIHDPTFSAYFKSGEDVPEQPAQPIISGFHSTIIIGITVSVTIIILLKKEKKRNSK